MNSLIIEPTKDTPAIHFNTEKNEFQIEGNSLPENAAAFYKPVYDWILNYTSSNKPGFKLAVNLNYLNSSSVKFIFAILMKLNEAHQANEADSNYKILWKHRELDELMKQKGEEFSSFLAIPFEVLSY